MDIDWIGRNVRLIATIFIGGLSYPRGAASAVTYNATSANMQHGVTTIVLLSLCRHVGGIGTDADGGAGARSATTRPVAGTRRHCGAQREGA